MSTTQPAAPAPTPTPRTLDEAKQALYRANELVCRETHGDIELTPGEMDELERKIAEARTAIGTWPAKQPVPDAGVRWSDIATVIADYNDQLSGVSPSDRPLSLTEMELANRLTALFPAPTPATSEDTLLLNWLESQYGNVRISEVKGSHETLVYVWATFKFRDSLRAAMAQHAGAQKT